MKLLDQLKNLGANFREYLESEKELVKLKIVKHLSQGAAQLISVLFIIILFHIMLAIFGIWLGVYLGGVLDSYPLGFGISTLVFVAWMIIVIVFRKQILIRPLTNAAINMMINEDKLPDHDKEPKGSGKETAGADPQH